MLIDTRNIISMTEANQNFSKVARMVDKSGSAVIVKNNKPRYLIITFTETDDMKLASDEDVASISRKLIQRNRKAYRDLLNDRSF